MKLSNNCLEFIKNHRICVLTTVDKDGKPYSSTMHYSSEDGLTFVFLTEKDSFKCRHFLNDKSYPASLTIGFSEEEFIEFQSQGNVKILSNEKDLKKGWRIYSSKFPESDKWRDSKTDVLLEFKCDWWKYTEFKTKVKLMSSER